MHCGRPVVDCPDLVDIYNGHRVRSGRLLGTARCSQPRTKTSSIYTAPLIALFGGFFSENYKNYRREGRGDDAKSLKCVKGWKSMKRFGLWGAVGRGG